MATPMVGSQLAFVILQQRTHVMGWFIFNQSPAPADWDVGGALEKQNNTSFI